MADRPEPEHVFRVKHTTTKAEFIAADYMTYDPDGTIRLFVYTNTMLSDTVAVVCPYPGVSVVRVDTLITTEGLKET